MVVDRNACTHVVIGEKELVGVALSDAYRDGRLLALGEPVELADGRVQITAVVAEPTAAPVSTRPCRRWRRVRPWLLGAGAVIGVGAVVGLVWLLMLAVAALIGAVQAVAAWIGTNLWLVGLVLLGLLLLGGTSACRCTGLHCDGRRR
jgi:hypothetical protein